MVEILSPVRILRSRRTSITNVEETAEIDFSLALMMGIRIHAVEFGLREAIMVVADDTVLTHQVHMSLHVEIGALEGAIDAFPADATILNSEIIAETTLQMHAFSSSVPAASGEMVGGLWLQPMAWNFHQLVGGALDFAQNLTLRTITSEAGLTVSGAQVTIYYQYIKLTKAELGEQFALRR